MQDVFKSIIEKYPKIPFIFFLMNRAMYVVILIVIDLLNQGMLHS